MTKPVSGVLIDVDGTHVDLNDVVWMHLAPCGCYSGATNAWTPPPYTGNALATVEQVKADWYEGEAWRRKRDEANGFTFVPKTRTWYGEQIDAGKASGVSFMDCPHDPKWGYAHRPEVDGYSWAGQNRGRSLHLIAWPWDDDRQPWRGDKVASLCGRSSGWGWSRQWHATNKPECVKCVEIAHKRLATAGEPAAPLTPALDGMLV
jgi:hypothetical protein